MGPELSGAVIVLSHPRSGSSMLMQTLRLLGVPVHGTAEVPHLSREANPRGYWEDRRLVRQGLDGLAGRVPPVDLRGKAFKLGVRALVHPARAPQWEIFAASDARFLLPVRDPAESIMSRTVFMEENPVARTRFIQLTSLVLQRRLEYVLLASRVLSHHHALAGRLDVVPFEEAHSDPAAWVARVARLVGRTEAPLAAAVANISPDLYRYDASRIPSHVRECVEKAGLPRVHAWLRETPPRWDAILAWGSELGIAEAEPEDQKG